LRLGVFALNPAQKLLNFVVAAGHQKQKRIGTILKNQPDVQANADFKIASRQPANAQPSMRVRMAYALKATDVASLAKKVRADALLRPILILAAAMASVISRCHKF